jgi:uncharacterized iron-regulated membrane protein
LLSKDKSKIASSTRLYRKIHKWVAIPMLLFMLLMGATGVLLGLKKPLELLPPTEKGESKYADQWLSINELMEVAKKEIGKVADPTLEIDRMDIRPDKGIVKIIFKDSFQEIQLDMSSGGLVSTGIRHSDWIEKLHDGSILDFLGKWKNEPSKQIYSTIIGLALILLSISGFYLWINPRRIRALS